MPALNKQTLLIGGLIIAALIAGAFLMKHKKYGYGNEHKRQLSEKHMNGGNMSFFITSTNPGKGANFGGLAGADAHCKALATAVGAGDKEWRAYLSTVAKDGQPAVNAKDRIGAGPWYNSKGILIARNVEDLHSSTNPINKETGLDEKGNLVNGRGDTPNVHDILTGSNADGTVAIQDGDTTCSNWTSDAETGSAVVGHHDRIGINDSAPMKSWVSSHGSRGCSLSNLNSTGGGGLLYCFAVSK